MEQHPVVSYSSNVQLSLVVDGKKHRLSQIGPDYIVIRNGCELPAADAEVVMAIDGRESRWPVRLTNGAVPFDRHISISDRS